jgi:phosphoenolpyruvate carboxylase
MFKKVLSMSQGKASGQGSHRRTGSLFQSEEGAKLDELARASSYLSGRGESKEFNAFDVIEECDELLRTIFFAVVRETVGEEFLNKLMRVYEASEKFGASKDSKDFEAMKSMLDGMAVDESLQFASAYSNLLNLHNISEQVANAMEERHKRLDDIPKGRAKTTNGAIKGLIRAGKSTDEIYAALANQHVDLVLTAHPTQALRRSMLKSFGKIREKLLQLQRFRLSHYERAEVLDEIRSSVAAAWRTDEIRRTPPKPQDEMRQGLTYFQQTIWDGIPTFMRRVDTSLLANGCPRLPLDRSLVTFGSWMGGDRDGNPYVTSTCTRDVVLLARVQGVNLLFHAIQRLIFELSMWRCNVVVKELASNILENSESDKQKVFEERKKRNYDDFWKAIPSHEPYRVILAELRDKLYNTREALQRAIADPDVTIDMHDDSIIRHKEELFEPLVACYESLIEVGDGQIANAYLLDVIRQVQCFGLGLVKLDIRQESDRHAEAIDAVTRFIGLGSYLEWSEEKKIEWLTSELNSKRPLLPHGLECSAEVQEVLDTCKMIAHLQQTCPGSLGTYVISMATCASDVLGVVLLQRECGCRKEDLLRVAPLFERLDDLNDAPRVLRQLFSVPWYHDHISGFQEVMIGYSDSGKDAGRMAAAWALYDGQEKVVQAGKEFDVALTLFHGRGGTVGRGGGPAHIAMLSQPPGTVNGSIRVTVQGEVIETDFGEKENCFHTLDLYTASVLEHTLNPPSHPRQEWREIMDKMSEYSCAQYRKTVFQTPEFVGYFGQATPGAELGSLNIGSRPAKRKPNAGVTALRAIPWIFAWTQSRFHLPVWLGISASFQKLIDDGELDTLREMYKSWPFFEVTIDLVEMVLAKADPLVVQYYERALVDETLHEFGASLRNDLQNSINCILAVSEHAGLLTKPEKIEASAEAAMAMHEKLAYKLLKRSLFITPLNICQVRYLAEARAIENATEAEMPDMAKLKITLLEGYPFQDTNYKGAVNDVLKITMKGIAAGMQNTG